MKRGQSALEYLVTYGWAILAIVIIAAVLWYFGVFSPAKWTESRQCGGFSAFTCIDYAVLSDTSPYSVQLSVGNKVGRTVIIEDDALGSNITLTTAAPVSVTITDAVNGASVNKTGTQYNIAIVYTDSDSSIQHTDIGFVT